MVPFPSSFVLRAYSNCTGPGFSLHSDMVRPYIANYGTKEQIEKFIPQMTAGKCIGAIAMTEPGAGRYVLSWFWILRSRVLPANIC